ncbi:MAG: glycosyltransferase family 9 protein [Candidatus Omnitrophica bacterium]|nr:glycosyltransferase family 9 protein [Candidatus Omnitrophota bacterium]
MDGIKNILFVRLSSLGDIILTTPVVNAVHERFPHASLFYLTKAQYKDLIVTHPFIKKVICIDSCKGLSGIRDIVSAINKIRAMHIDLVIDLHFPGWSLGYVTLWYFLITSLIKARTRISFKRPSFEQTIRIPADERKHTIDFYVETLKQHSIALDDKQPQIFIDKQDEDWSSAQLASKHMPRDGFLIGICPGASHLTKQWGKERFRLVCRELSLNSNNYFLFFEQEKGWDLVRYISRDLDQDKIIYALEFSLSKVIALMRRCNLVLANDSGLMHVASALGIPTIGLYGPTHPNLGFSPLGKDSQVLCADVPCSPCSRWGEKKCAINRAICFDAIKIEDVVKACRNKGGVLVSSA